MRTRIESRQVPERLSGRLLKMPNNNLIKSEIRQDADGRVSFILRAPIEYSTYVPKDLLRQPPKWAKDLVERGTTFVELVQTVGEVARRPASRAQYRSLLGVVEQLALTDEGRQMLDRILTPGFISWLVAITAPSRLAFFIPAIIVFENANAPGNWGWITPPGMTKRFGLSPLYSSYSSIKQSRRCGKTTFGRL